MRYRRACLLLLLPINPRKEFVHPPYREMEPTIGTDLLAAKAENEVTIAAPAQR